MAPTCPFAASSAAFAAAASLCSVSMISQADRLIPTSFAADLIFFNGQIKIGVIRPALTQSTTASSALGLTGWTIAVGIGCKP
jgi:hypothetical protein